MAKEHTIIDVRTKFEFMLGHIEGSINIPLQQISNQVEEIKKYDNLILCCASGHRSGQAVEYLKSLGIQCENGGSWKQVKRQLEQ